MPLPVAISIALLIASFGIDWIPKYVSGLYAAIPFAIALALSLSLIFALAAGLYLRKNWVRLLIIVLFPAGFLMAEAWKTFGEPLSAIQTILSGLQVLLLLFSGSCYGPNNSFKPRPLRGSA